jgi:hypothetical protein
MEKWNKPGVDFGGPVLFTSDEVPENENKLSFVVLLIAP